MDGLGRKVKCASRIPHPLASSRVTRSSHYPITLQKPARLRATRKGSPSLVLSLDPNATAELDSPREFSPTLYYRSYSLTRCRSITTVPHDQCNMVCTGNTSEYCGGQDRLNVYTYQPTTSTTTSTTTTTTLLPAVQILNDRGEFSASLGVLPPA